MGGWSISAETAPGVIVMMLASSATASACRGVERYLDERGPQPRHGAEHEAGDGDVCDHDVPEHDEREAHRDPRALDPDRIAEQPVEQERERYGEERRAREVDRRDARVEPEPDHRDEERDDRMRQEALHGLGSGG